MLKRLFGNEEKPDLALSPEALAALRAMPEARYVQIS
jgi:hypothetical protein